MSIAKNLESVRASISDAIDRAGRDRDSVRLVAVSKTWPASAVLEAVAAGHRDFGENRVQELLEKAPLCPSDLIWHLIGHLQANKVRKALSISSLIHSIDSQKLAQDVSRIAGELGQTAHILLQVNVASDDAKFGFPVDEIRRQFGEIAALPHLKIDGLMTVPPFEENPEKVRSHFASLRKLRDSLAERNGQSLPELSMGMSHDFAVAIAEGATLVRIGSAIFGTRDYSY